MNNKEKYEELRKKYWLNEKDTGSSQIQIINLTERINELTEHLKMQKKDIPAKRSLLKMVAARKRHLKYLKHQKYDDFNYEEFTKDLKIKG